GRARHAGTPGARTRGVAGKVRGPSTRFRPPRASGTLQQGRGAGYASRPCLRSRSARQRSCRTPPLRVRRCACCTRASRACPRDSWPSPTCWKASSSACVCPSRSPRARATGSGDTPAASCSWRARATPPTTSSTSRPPANGPRTPSRAIAAARRWPTRPKRWSRISARAASRRASSSTRWCVWSGCCRRRRRRRSRSGWPRSSRTGTAGCRTGRWPIPRASPTSITPMASRSRSMKLGLERLLEEPRLRRALAGRRVALLAHPASVTRELTHALDALIGPGGLRIAAAFGPQHGLRGDKQDNMIESEDYTEPVHGIPVYSLYGAVRRPTPAMMESFDVLLVDLQDVGCRVYTFITTLRYVLEAAAAHGKSVGVLDRPNPAGRPDAGLRP